VPVETLTRVHETRNQFTPRWQSNETYLSAEQIEAGSHTRIQSADGNEGRPPRIEAPTRQGSGEADAVRRRRSQQITAGPITNDDSKDSRFRRSNRLTDKHSFGRVFNKAQRSRDNMFTVLYRPNGRNGPRLGLAIGKRNCRRASGRNRLKRVIRESFRRHKAMLGGLDVVVINQSAATDAPNQALFDSLARHWTRCRTAKTKQQG
jgi:ribonuclease P protein component